MKEVSSQKKKSVLKKRKRKPTNQTIKSINKKHQQKQEKDLRTK
jgi:hypothetical protein